MYHKKHIQEVEVVMADVTHTWAARMPRNQVVKLYGQALNEHVHT